MSSGELAQSIWTWWTAYWVATTWCADKYQSIFLLLLLYLITVACILEISSGLCWHKDEWMGQRSTLNHNVQLFISLNNQCAIIMIIQWPSVEMYTCKLCPNQISITIWKFTTWVCIEHEVEVATSTRKHWLVYGI